MSAVPPCYEIDRRPAKREKREERKQERGRQRERDFKKQETPASVWPLSRRQLDSFSEYDRVDVLHLSQQCFAVPAKYFSMKLNSAISSTLSCNICDGQHNSLSAVPNVIYSVSNR